MVTSAPLMKTRMELQIPITLIKPNLDEIQSTFSQILNNILDTHKHIVMWGQRNTKRKQKGTLAFTELQLRNYFKTVSDHKEIVRIFMGLQGAMYLLKPDVIRLLQVFLRLSYTCP